MLEIHYAPGGQAVSDFELERTYALLIPKITSSDKYTMVYTTENIFLRVRVGVKQGDISNDDVRFIWNGTAVDMDEDGRVEHWPDGFLDTTEKLLESLI